MGREDRGMVWLGGLLVALSGCPSSDDRRPDAAVVENQDGEAPENRLEPAKYAEFTAEGVVVGFSRYLEVIVTREGDRLRVWSSRGEKVGELTARVPKRDARYAVSSDGAWVVETSFEKVHAMPVMEGREGWTLDERAFAPPVFSPDGKLLALPRRGDVALVDVELGRVGTVVGREQSTIGEPNWGLLYRPREGIRVAREVYFSNDGTRVAVTCGSNTPSASNHTVFIGDVDTGQIVAMLPGHAYPLGAVGFIGDDRIVTTDDDGVWRWFDHDGILHASVDGEGHTKARTIDTRRPDQMVIVESSGLVTVWRHDAGGFLPQRRFTQAVGGTLDDAGTLWTLTESGGLTSTPSARVAAGQPELHVVPHSQGSPDIQLALSLLDHRAYSGTVAQLEGQPESPVLDVTRELATFKRDAKLDDFAKHLRMGTPGEWTIAALIDVGQDRIARGDVELGSEVFLAWVSFEAEASRPAAERIKALSLGLNVASKLRSFDDDTDEALTAMLLRLWPDEVTALESYAESHAYDERVIKAADSFIRSHPDSHKAWHVLVVATAEKRSDVDRVIARMGKALPAEDVQTWEEIGDAYWLSERLPEAVEAYDRGLSIDPRNEHLLWSRDRRAAELEALPATWADRLRRHHVPAAIFSGISKQRDDFDAAWDACTDPRIRLWLTWAKGVPPPKIVDAVARPLIGVLKGLDIDPEHRRRMETDLSAVFGAIAQSGKGVDLLEKADKLATDSSAWPEEAKRLAMVVVHMLRAAKDEGEGQRPGDWMTQADAAHRLLVPEFQTREKAEQFFQYSWGPLVKPPAQSSSGE